LGGKELGGGGKSTRPVSLLPVIFVEGEEKKFWRTVRESRTGREKKRGEKGKRGTVRRTPACPPGERKRKKKKKKGGIDRKAYD